ncbi:caspase family protein [Bradyrhizobium vignae]|uniref:Peptidase C14 caspase domain-containing protein n=1 Tax=Bradyrhizobium vignae TaxID=1549949 RepID=A0A2U3PUF3_9BRAD|nr:caspase family protein [Bradyrhizobium vignae]SPP92801.1 protein of unknown function [Bradyrhizobium vignae]
MGRRALIIGIEEYGSVSDNSIAAKLPGTLRSAMDFRDWLIGKWDAENVLASERQIIFCSEPAIEGGEHATAEDLTQALLQLKAAGQNSTEEFFFYFSGHGFSFVEPDARSDVIIASNYKAMQLSGGACMRLDKAIYWLRQHLGFGRQFYFVDACRNDLDGRKINPGGVIPRAIRRRPEKRRPTCCSLPLQRQPLPSTEGLPPPFSTVSRAKALPKPGTTPKTTP